MHAAHVHEIDESGWRAGKEGGHEPRRDQRWGGGDHIEVAMNQELGIFIPNDEVGICGKMGLKEGQGRVSERKGAVLH